MNHAMPPVGAAGAVGATAGAGSTAGGMTGAGAAVGAGSPAQSGTEVEVADGWETSPDLGTSHKIQYVSVCSRSLYFENDER